MDLQASVVDKQAMKVYVQLDRVDQPMETKLLVLDLAGDRVEEIILQKPIAPKHSRQFLAIYQMRSSTRNKSPTAKMKTLSSPISSMTEKAFSPSRS